MSIRMPAVSGRFYPGEEQQLRKELQKYFKASSAPEKGAPAALIVPHAGYVFSGAVAAGTLTPSLQRPAISVFL
ncbi:MAG: AmmeMemoRadiSam system protein B [Bacteroidales bacterium]|nr:AmmeMemoRadiSam system protein B [Bacteroidales bacterium]